MNAARIALSHAALWVAAAVGMDRQAARVTYAACRAAYIAVAEACCCGGTFQTFEADCRDAIDCARPLERVHANAKGEVVYERAIAPWEWADAAQFILGQLLQSYCVAERLHPGAAWEREQWDNLSGLSEIDDSPSERAAEHRIHPGW